LAGIVSRRATAVNRLARRQLAHFLGEAGPVKARGKFDY
jgi:hypothetical protein